MLAGRIRKVLVVDDVEKWLNLFASRFVASSESDDCPYSFHLDRATSLIEAIELIQAARENRSFYDVVVFDMKLESDRAGLDGVASLWASHESGEELPVIIVFTGYPSYPTCVEAIRKGAWDYVVKQDVNKRPVVQMVVDSAINRLRELDSRPVLREAFNEWYGEHSEELKAAYGGMVVALWHLPSMQVVASGADSFALERALQTWQDKHAPWEQPLIMKVPNSAERSG